MDLRWTGQEVEGLEVDSTGTPQGSLGGCDRYSHKDHYGSHTWIACYSMLTVTPNHCSYL